MKYKVVVAYGNDAERIMQEHKNEIHSAEEWYNMFSEVWDGFNPTEIREFDFYFEVERLMRDKGTLIPKFYKVFSFGECLA